jgi:ribonuclease HI
MAETKSQVNKLYHTAYVDGLCEPNPGQMAIGGCIIDPSGGTVKEFSETVGEGTNNKAEYLAVSYVLCLAIEIGIENLKVYTDSKLVANQINGEWRVKDPDLQRLHKGIQEAMDSAIYAEIEWIPREKNERADRLSEKARSI